MQMPLPYRIANGVLTAFPFVATRNVVIGQGHLIAAATPRPDAHAQFKQRLSVACSFAAAPSPDCRPKSHAASVHEVSTIEPLTSRIGAGKTLVHYMGSDTPDADGHWTFTNAADINDRFVFAVKMSCSKRISIRRRRPAASSASVRRARPASPICLPTGGSVLADWSKFTISGSSIAIDTMSPTGPATAATFPLLLLSAGEPQGFRKIDLGGCLVSFVTLGSAVCVGWMCEPERRPRADRSYPLVPNRLSGTGTAARRCSERVALSTLWAVTQAQSSHRIELPSGDDPQRNQF